MRPYRFRDRAKRPGPVLLAVRGEKLISNHEWTRIDTNQNQAGSAKLLLRRGNGKMITAKYTELRERKLWTAVAERSGDTALGSRRTRGNFSFFTQLIFPVAQSAVAAALCRRTPWNHR